MAETLTIARPYAEAAFKVAKQKGKNAENLWAEQLQQLALIAKNADAADFIHNPENNAATVADLFISCLKTEDNKKDPEFENFIRLLADNHRIALLPEISVLFNQDKSEQEGVRDAIIYSAFPLTDEQKNQVLKDFEPKFGCKLKSGDVQIDKNLIGGVRVCVGDKILDASVRGRLEQMSMQLTAAS